METPDEIFMTPLLLDARHDAAHDVIDDDAPPHSSCVRTANRTGMSPTGIYIYCSEICLILDAGFFSVIVLIT